VGCWLARRRRKEEENSLPYHAGVTHWVGERKVQTLTTTTLWAQVTMSDLLAVHGFMARLDFLWSHLMLMDPWVL